MGRDARNYLESIISVRDEAIRASDEMGNPFRATIYDGGWDDGYKTGYQDGLDAVSEAHKESGCL